MGGQAHISVVNSFVDHLKDVAIKSGLNRGNFAAN